LIFSGAGSWGAELAEGEIALVLRKNFAFYLALFLSAASPLAIIVIIVLGYRGVKYKREKRHLVIWPAAFGLGWG
jgi:hypothetical protein